MTPRRLSRRGQTSLYRYFSDAGVLLYVGISANAIARLVQHKSGAEWFFEVRRIEVVHFADRATAALAEQIAIFKERPVHNIQGQVDKIKTEKFLKFLG